jgi:cyanophycinase
MKEPNYEKPNNCPVPKGILVLIGGAEDKGDKQPDQKDPAEGVKQEVLECFIKLINKKNPHIEVVTSGGEKDPDGTFLEYKKVFNELGAGTINQIHHAQRGDVKFTELEPRLRACDGIFMAGGDQLKLTSIYGGTQFLTLLKQRYIHEKIVIAGTSAGAMAMSTPMIFAGTGRDEMINGNVKITTGLEFIRDVCVDTHFVDRGRFVRMAQVIATNPTCIGLGVEEDTALVIKNGRDGEVIGSGVVIILNGQDTYETNIPKNQLLTLRGLQVHILSKGALYSFPEMNPPHK